MSISTKLKLYFVVLTTGACTMIFELIAPRLYSPFFGTSTYIWTVVIGVVMASLSIGYFVGGKVTDKHSAPYSLLTIVFMASLISFLFNYFKDSVIYSIFINHSNRINAVLIASIVMLSPTNIFLGAVTPITIKLLNKKKEDFGRTSGDIYAISTIGSLLGTFVSGFWLIPSFGIHKVLFGISTVLLIDALIVCATYQMRIVTGLIFICLIVYLLLWNREGEFARFYKLAFGGTLIADLNTEYDRIWIYDLKGGKEPIRVLANSQSLLFLNKSVTTMMRGNRSYFSFFNLAQSYNEDIKNVLMIGGGAYTYASYYMEAYPDVNVDVVEIDNDLVEISKKYFGLNPTSKFHNFPLDGRIFLNTNKKKYDVIFLDAYRNGDATPFQLITKEAMQLMRNSLSENGLLFINVISSIEGRDSNLFKAQFKTVSSVFEHIKVFPVWDKNPRVSQNIVLMAVNGREIKEATFSKKDYDLSVLNQNAVDMKEYGNTGQILTDDHAPVEFFDLQR